QRFGGDQSHGGGPARGARRRASRPGTLVRRGFPVILAGKEARKPMRTARILGIALALGAASFAFSGCDRSNPYDNKPDGHIDRVQRVEKTETGVKSGKVEQKRTVEDRPIDK